MEAPVRELAARQLEAYNARDLEAFCACYHDEVRVLDENGEATMEGLATFRERYGALFEGVTELHAEVDERLVLGRHCIDHERFLLCRPGAVPRPHLGSRAGAPSLTQGRRNSTIASLPSRSV